MTSDTSLYYTAGTPFGTGVVLCGHLAQDADEPTGSVLVAYADGTWRLLATIRDRIIHDVASSAGGWPLYALDRSGEVLVYSENVGSCNVEKIPTRCPRYLEGLREVNGSIYAFGGCNQVFVRQVKGWVAIDDGIFESFSPRAQTSILCIERFGIDKLLACGRRGFAALRGRSGWARLDPPTNFDLNVAISVDGGGALIGGDAGVLFAVSEENVWSAVFENQELDIAIWDIAVVDDKAYVTTGEDVIEISGVFSDAPEISNRQPIGLTRFVKSEAVWGLGSDGLAKLEDGAWTLIDTPLDR